MQINLDLALAKRLFGDLATLLSNDWAQADEEFDSEAAKDNLIQLARAIWETEEPAEGE